VWSGNSDAPAGELADFELKLKSRLNGRGGINNGFQFRSRLLPDHDMAGYQVDNNLQTDWLVRLYDEFGRHTLAHRGERTTFDEQGKRTTSKLELDGSSAPFKLEEWHEYHLICVGNKLTLKVNGQLVAEVIDRDPRRQDLQGKLGLQLHSGPETIVQFKDIRLKVLKRAEIPAPPLLTRRERDREKLLSGAFVRWDLGAGGHGSKFPLQHAADFYGVEFDVRAVGTGARPGARVCRFQGGCFSASREFPSDMEEWTCYIRYLQQPDTTKGTLLSKGPAEESPFSFSTQPSVWQPKGPDKRITRMEFQIQILHEANQEPRAIRLEDAGGEQWIDLIAVHNGKREGYYMRPTGSQKLFPFTNAAPLPRNRLPLGIGGVLTDKRATSLFTGEMEEIAIWSRVLTEDEIDTLSPAAELPQGPQRGRPRFRRRGGPLANVGRDYFFPSAIGPGTAASSSGACAEADFASTGFGGGSGRSSIRGSGIWGAASGRSGAH
jgi:hypothetical protein